MSQELAICALEKAKESENKIELLLLRVEALENYVQFLKDRERIKNIDVMG